MPIKISQLPPCQLMRVLGGSLSKAGWNFGWQLSVAVRSFGWQFVNSRSGLRVAVVWKNDHQNGMMWPQFFSWWFSRSFQWYMQIWVYSKIGGAIAILVSLGQQYKKMSLSDAGNELDFSPPAKRPMVFLIFLNAGFDSIYRPDIWAANVQRGSNCVYGNLFPKIR